MNDNDIIDAWQRSRREVDVPAGFAERVMESLPAADATARRNQIARLFALLVATRWGKAVVCSVAALIGLAPLSFVILSLFFSPPLLSTT